MPRQRAADELRPVRLTCGFTEATPGSVLIEMGRTRVLCTASIEQEVPRWMRDSGRGWVTAEYGMLPGSSPERVSREAYQGGRAKEISRLVGRALRSVVDLSLLGEAMVRVDCDVIEADGGTHTAATTGDSLALHDALVAGERDGLVNADALIDHVAAVSVGIVDGQVLLDLEYESDVAADVDMNVVMSGRGELVEVQGTAEHKTFTRKQLNAMLDLAQQGIEQLIELQRQAVE